MRVASSICVTMDGPSEWVGNCFIFDLRIYAQYL